MKSEQYLLRAVTALLLGAPTVGPLSGCDRSAPKATSAPAQAEPAESAPTEKTSPQRESHRTEPFEVPQVDTRHLSETVQKQLAHVRQLARELPDSSDRIAELGMQYFANGFPRAAADCFQRASTLLPRAMRFKYLLGLAREASGDLPEAVKAYEDAIALDDAYPALFVNLANLLVESDVSRAKWLYGRAVALDPDDAVAHWGLGECARLEKNKEEALAHYERALEIDPQYADAHYAVAQIFLSQGRRRDAEEHLRRHAEGRKAQVRNDPIRFELVRRARGENDIAAEALQLAKRGEVDRAAAYLEKALDAGIAGAPIRRALASVYILQRRHQEAVFELRAALESEPESDETKSGLGLALAELGQLDDAETLFQDVLSRNPNDPVTLNRLGMLKLRRGGLDEAESLLTAAAELGPKNSAYQYNLAELYVGSAKLAEALKHIQKAVELAPKNAAARYLHGLILSRLDRSDEAAAAWKRAIELQPALPDAYLALANAARHAKRYDAAIRFLQDGLRHSPDAAPVANDLAWILATSPEDRFREGARAVRLAKQACGRSAYKNPGYLDTLAAAYAEIGQYDKAVKTERKAIELASQAPGAAKAVSEMRARLAAYEARKPYRED